MKALLQKLLNHPNPLPAACLGLIALLAATPAAGNDQRVGDFALIDADGAFHHMAWYNDHAAVVILPYSPASPDLDALHAMLDLQSRYGADGTKRSAKDDADAAFFLLHPGGTGQGTGQDANRQAVRAALTEAGLHDGTAATLPVLMDDTLLVAQSLGLSHFNQAVVYSPTSFKLFYRGPVDKGLERVLQQVVDGKAPALKEVAISDAQASQPIDYGALEGMGSLSYVDDIAPIIIENCAECHRQGGIAPFAMDSRLALQGWAPMIREVVMTRRMPPGQIDNKVGHRMRNEMNLSDEEMQKLVAWIDSGAQVQDQDRATTDPLTALTWPDTKWKLAERLGEPDLIVQIPPQTIPATGVVEYMNIPVDLGLTEDRWVRASEVAPGRSEVLHHIITTVVPPEGATDPRTAMIAAINSLPEERAAAIRGQLFATFAAGERPNMQRIFAENPDIDLSFILGGGTNPDQSPIAGYAPGNSYFLNPEGSGGLLKAGTTLNLQMHYTTFGKEVTDASEIAVYFYPPGEEPAERMSGGVGNSFNISIPPQAKDHEMELITHIKQDVEVYDLMPHMHFRGKRMAFSARYPDGREELLLSVPAYSFNWQLAHVLERPLPLPAGSQIIARGAFDNSAQNPANPDPEIEVNWGEQSWEEMFMGFYTWKETQQDERAGGQ